jgi:hypothetical protein
MAGGLIAAVPFSLRSYTRLEIAAHLTGSKQARPMRVPPAAPPVSNRPLLPPINVPLGPGGKLRRGSTIGSPTSNYQTRSRDGLDLDRIADLLT